MMMFMVAFLWDFFSPRKVLSRLWALKKTLDWINLKKILPAY